MPAQDQPTRCIAHCDADRFFFAVEALERPELASDPRPVVIGHDPSVAPRAVVTTANDPARRLGINSALSCARARRLAPDAVFIPPRHDLYRAHSERLMALLRSQTSLFQQLSIDEAWLDWSAEGFDAARAGALRELVLRQTGLSVSIGVASSKLVAKMATETAKGTPEHVWVVKPGGEAAYLAPQPVRALIGVGPRTAERLAELGIRTIGELAAQELGRLIEVFGRNHGQSLFEHSRGIDDSALHPEREARSYSAEHTFQQDTADRRALWRELCEQAEELGQRLREEGLRAGEVAIKLRYADFTTLTRQSRLAAPSDRAEVLAETAAALMRRHWERGRPIRLIGLRAARLEPSGRPIQLAMETPDRRPG